MNHQNKLYILGSSSALPTATRFSSAQVLKLSGKLFLIDCGEATQIRLRQSKVRLQKINHIFISHLHGDHYLGLVGLISTLNLLGKQSDLHLFAFPALREIIEKQIEVSGLVLQFKIHYHFLNTDGFNQIMDERNIEVFSFPLKHRIETCGFLFREKAKPRNILRRFILENEVPIPWFERIKNGEDYIDKDGRFFKNETITQTAPIPKSFAYCSDTIYLETIIPFIKNVDLLYHEATFAEDLRDMSKLKFHSTAKQAATIALKASAKKLVIGHFSARYSDLNILLNEAREVFSETILAEDLSVIDFP